MEVAPQPPKTDGGGGESLVGCGKAQYKGDACTVSDSTVDLQFRVHAFEQPSYNRKPEPARGKEKHPPGPGIFGMAGRAGPSAQAECPGPYREPRLRHCPRATGSASTSTEPPSGVNLNAFVVRLSRTRPKGPGCPWRWPEQCTPKPESNSLRLRLGCDHLANSLETSREEKRRPPHRTDPTSAPGR